MAFRSRALLNIGQNADARQTGPGLLEERATWEVAVPRPPQQGETMTGPGRGPQLAGHAGGGSWAFLPDHRP